MKLPWLRWPRLRRPRHPDVIVVVAAVAAAGALGFALRPQHTPTVTVAPASAEIQRPVLPQTKLLTALVISDSYTSGSGLPETSYACRAVTQMGWLCQLAAEPGTGYISGGDANRFPLDQGRGQSSSFGERVTALSRYYSPDIVIFDGGRDDTFAPPVARFQVTVSAIWQAHQTWPKARIVFVKPRFLATPDDDLGVNDDIVDLLRQATEVKDLVVIDPIIRFKDTDTKGMISPDGTNPNREGEEALAAALVEEFSQNGMQPAT